MTGPAIQDFYPDDFAVCHGCGRLNAQGMQMNQLVTFLSDGGDTVRELQLYLNPQAEHILDWFHVAMRVTMLRQLALGLPGKPVGRPFRCALPRPGIL